MDLTIRLYWRKQGGKFAFDSTIGVNGERQVLADLDVIDWGMLTHAYGEALDVPGMLRCLLSSDAATREQAISGLYGSIWHQGTVYSATARAIPFLYELLAAPEVLIKSEIAHLLACCADGRGYLEVHAVGTFGDSAWRRILSKEGKSLEDELVREAAEINSVRQVASAGLPRLIPYLRDSEPEIRRAVAAAFGRYPEHAVLSLPALNAASSSETDEEVREALYESMTRLRELNCPYDEPRKLEVQSAGSGDGD